MLVKHRGGIILMKHNCIVQKKRGGALKNSIVTPNCPIFGLTTNQYTAPQNRQFLGSSIYNVNFKPKKKGNIKFII